MSRKSRQKGARRKLRQALPVWLAIPLLIAGLALGTICVTMPFIASPPEMEDMIEASATLQQVEPDYRYHRKHQELHSIRLYFTDHEPLSISTAITHDDLLDRLEDCEPGTVFNMLVEKDGTSILAISVDGMDILTFETSLLAITVNNRIGFGLGIFFLAIAGYCAWSLIMAWRYRRIL